MEAIFSKVAALVGGLAVCALALSLVEGKKNAAVNPTQSDMANIRQHRISFSPSRITSAAASSVVSRVRCRGMAPTIDLASPNAIAQRDNKLAQRAIFAMPEHVAPLPRNLLDAISSTGIDVARLAKRVGLTANKLERGVTYAESDRFLTAAWEAIGDPAFGLVVGIAIKPELYSVVGYSALTSATLGAAFEKLIRYNRLVWGDFSEIVRSPGRATIRLVHVGPERPYTRAKLDMQLAGKVAFANRFTGVAIVPVAVTVRRARPTWAGRYQDVFGCPVQFGYDEDSIVFRQQDLDRPLISANA